MSTTIAADMAGYDHDADYAAFLVGVRSTFAGATAGGAKLFSTATDGLFNDRFLACLPGDRQTHTCTCCRRFFDTYGGLVTIDADGTAASALWDPDQVPAFYRDAMAVLRDRVTRQPVTGIFLARERMWGTPHSKGGWNHVAVPAPAYLVSKDRLRSPSQIIAAKREDLGTVARALQEFSPDLLGEALRVLQADAVNLAERFIGPVQWLLDLHTARAATRGMARDNVLWRAIASAPDGYCHPRSSVVGTLLEDLAAGLSFEDVRRRFKAKTHPLQFQRPQAAPTAGNIARAEKIFETLGLAPALERRFARLDELETIWKPAEPKPATAKRPAGGVFGHLEPKGSAPATTRGVDLPSIVMTWEKFARTVLPTAEAIDVLMPTTNAPLIALTTAVHADAPPLLKWDREDRRNPVAWYVWSGGAPPQTWRLQPGAWAKVTAVTPLPTMWGDQPQPHQGDGAILVLDGAVDTRNNGGNALFPTFLRGELHEVRATIERHSLGAKLAGSDEASACGWDLRKSNRAINCTLRASTAGRWTTYRIDRWD